MNNTPLNLKARAREVMTNAGFHPDFPAEVVQAGHDAKAKVPNGSPNVRDMRALLWSSIDNDSSRDLDQVEYVENLPDGTTRVLVGIADVDASVPKDSATDKRASTETTSVYTGVTIFPMLPNEFSTDATSLLPDVDRLAIVIEMHVKDSGEVGCYDVYPAWLRNRAKLAYNSTGAWLEGRGPMPEPIARVPGMEAQLRLQADISRKLRGLRRQRGSLDFGSIEAMPVVQDGEVKDLQIIRHNQAEFIIESFMVAANVAMARNLKEEKSISIRRVVKTPKRWDRIQSIAQQFGVKLPDTPDPRALSDFLEKRKAADPDHFPDLSLSVVKLLGPGEYIVEHLGSEQNGHFALAVQDYTHSTAPNRRFGDLVTQRLLKATMTHSAAPYNEPELAQIAKHCTEREDAAKKVERTMRKIVAANLLSKQIGQVFDGIITGASAKGTFVRLLKFPAEGMVVRNARGADVGDKVRVKLVATDAYNGFVDFERI